jgi:hypothetical protein
MCIPCSPRWSSTRRRPRRAGRRHGGRRPVARGRMPTRKSWSRLTASVSRRCASDSIAILARRGIRPRLRAGMHMAARAARLSRVRERRCVRIPAARFRIWERPLRAGRFPFRRLSGGVQRVATDAHCRAAPGAAAQWLNAACSGEAKPAPGASGRSALMRCARVGAAQAGADEAEPGAGALSAARFQRSG